MNAASAVGLTSIPQELSRLVTCEEPGCLSGCHLRADARKLHGVNQVNTSGVSGKQHFATVAETNNNLRRQDETESHAVLTSSRVSGPQGGNPRVTLCACEPTPAASQVSSSSLSSSLSLSTLCLRDSPARLNPNDEPLK